MMHGGSKTIGSRNAMGRQNELEDYFAELKEPQSDYGTSATGSQANGHSEELRRLTAYVDFLKQRISEIAQSPVGTGRTTWLSTAPRVMGASLAGCLFAGLAAGLTARLLAGRR